MFPSQRTNTNYISIYPFNAKKIARTSNPILPVKTSTRRSMADKINTRKPGTRKPRVIARYVEAKPTSVNNTVPLTVDSVMGVEHFFNEQPRIKPNTDSVMGFSHLFR